MFFFLFVVVVFLALPYLYRGKSVWKEGDRERPKMVGFIGSVYMMMWMDSLTFRFGCTSCNHISWSPVK